MFFRLLGCPCPVWQHYVQHMGEGNNKGFARVVVSRAGHRR